MENLKNNKPPNHSFLSDDLPSEIQTDNYENLLMAANGKYGYMLSEYAKLAFKDLSQ
jgi:hypothetical protein